jgi:hypothetical protein
VSLGKMGDMGNNGRGVKRGPWETTSSRKRKATYS